MGTGGRAVETNVGGLQAAREIGHTESGLATCAKQHAAGAGQGGEVALIVEIRNKLGHRNALETVVTGTHIEDKDNK